MPFQQAAVISQQKQLLPFWLRFGSPGKHRFGLGRDLGPYHRSTGQPNTGAMPVCELYARCLKGALKRLDGSLLQFVSPLKSGDRVRGNFSCSG